MGHITFKHYANAGDLAAILAGVKGVCETLNAKAVLYQQLNVRADYYPGAVHPVTDKDGAFVCMNEKQFEMLAPLIKAQDYVEDFLPWEGQEIVVDLDVVRGRTFANLPYGMIQSWPMFAFPDMACDLSQPWLKAEKLTGPINDSIILNFTQRYRNPSINYFFLKKYQDRCFFVGTRTEHELFCSTWKIDVPYREVKDFLELAGIINSCKFFLGNQSMCWNIANGLGHPRILEMYAGAPNCQPFVGPDNYGFYHQPALEYYVDKLIKS